MVAQNDTLEEHSRHILTDVFGARYRSLQAVMRPRTEVTCVDAGLSAANARTAVQDGPNSRFPVIDGSPDDVLGFIHIRGLMPRGRDLVEELVGEIYDEYDDAADPEDHVTKANGSIEVDGGLILQEFHSATGVELPEGRYETVAGFVIDRLGRLPRTGGPGGSGWLHPHGAGRGPAAHRPDPRVTPQPGNYALAEERGHPGQRLEDAVGQRDPHQGPGDGKLAGGNFDGRLRP